MADRAAFFLSKVRLRGLKRVESGSDENDPYVKLEVEKFFIFETHPLLNEVRKFSPLLTSLMPRSITMGYYTRHSS